MNKFTTAIKIIAVMLVTALVFASCDKQTIEEIQEEVVYNPQATISLPYDSTGSLNPFKTSSRLNYDIIPLMYDSLYKVDSSLSPVNCLATGGVTEKNTVTVSISSAKFSDGSDLTAEDVIYSFNRAKKSKNYSAGLADFDSCTASGYTLVFTLNRENSYALSLLVFPIVKSDSAERASDIPIGTGKYYYDKENSSLEINSYNNSTIKDIRTIKLYGITDTSKLKYNLDIGSISAFTYNFSSYRISGLLNNVSRQSTNSLVYLGFNSSSVYLSDNCVRRAVSKSLNRESIASSVYGQNATETYMPFNPEWSAVKNITLSPSDTSVDFYTASVLLNEAGYDTILESGLRSGENGVLSLTILVCKDNEYRVSIAEAIQTALKKSGINTGILKCTSEEYLENLRTGNYDMYIGEVRLPNDCSLSSFFSSSGSSAYGINQSGKSAESYNLYKNGEIGIEEFLETFFFDCPFAPLCFRYDIIAYGTDIDSDSFDISGDLYYNIGQWTVSTDKKEG